MKETLEEAAEACKQYWKGDIPQYYGYMKFGFKSGANWHKERVIEMIDSEIKILEVESIKLTHLRPYLSVYKQLKQQILNDGK